MKVLLVAPIQEDAQIQNWGAPCLGIIRIAAYLKNRLGCEVEILQYDSQIDHYDPLEKYKDCQIDIVGVSLLHYTLFDSLVFLNKFKELHPESLLVVGGNEAGANYQDIFEKAPVDIVVTAEGEDTLLDIILWKMGEVDLDDIDGIIYRKYARPINPGQLWSYWRDVDFSKCQYQEYWKTLADLYEHPDYEKINYIRLMTSSHCQRKCTFCSLSNVRDFSCGKRVKPVMLTGEQIMELVARADKQLPGLRTVYFCTDDVFYPDKEPFLDFIKRYWSTKYNHRILIQTSTFSLKQEYFPLLKNINCQHITIGFENCSERLRKSLGKAQSMEKMEEIIQWGKKYEIQIYVLIMLMPPETSMEDLIENYETLSHWVADGVQISVEPVIYPYRGTEIFNQGYDIEYQTQEKDGVSYRDAKFIYPKDPLVRELCCRLIRERDQFVKDYFKDKDNQHMFKGQTGVALVSLLGKLLKEYISSYSYEGL